jgi:ribonuclease HII
MRNRSIKQIEKELFHNPCSLSEQELQSLYEDSRKGVQRLLLKWMKHKAKQEKLVQKYRFMCTYEEELYGDGKTLVAGIDEVGRGPLAGPVVAAAVILRRDVNLIGINDSKQLSEKDREIFYKEIRESAEAIGLGIVSAKEIDRYNIYQASKKAMVQAVEALELTPHHLLLDAMDIPASLPQTSIVKGDAKSISIAAASIVAKVSRDRMMGILHEKYPQYGFGQHMGYATAYHLQALEKYGVCDEHRCSFSPVKSQIS